MPCIPMIDTRTKKRVGFMCGFHPLYDFGGHLFEIHSHCGPTPLRRDNHDPKVSVPPSFWPVWKRFEKLTEQERDKFRFED